MGWWEFLLTPTPAQNGSLTQSHSRGTKGLWHSVPRRPLRDRPAKKEKGLSFFWHSCPSAYWSVGREHPTMATNRKWSSSAAACWSPQQTYRSIKATQLTFFFFTFSCPFCLQLFSHFIYLFIYCPFFSRDSCCVSLFLFVCSFLF